jgi:protease IV
MAAFSDYVKNIFWVLVLIQFAPLLIKSIRSQYSELLESKTKVGIITIKGMIANATPTINEIKQIFEAKDIKAVVFKIDSGGGVSSSSQAIFQEILHYKKQHPEKNVFTIVEQMAASGAYYVACATDYILATPSALIGSIGVYIAHPNFKEFIEQFKIGYSITKSGTYKGAGNPLLTLTPEQKAQFQELSNDTYRQFLRDVTQQRPQLPTDQTKWAEGRIFTGEQALELGMIDAVGTASTLEKALREKAQIVGGIEWVKPTKKRSFLASLFAQDDDDDASSYVETFINTICQTLESRYSAAAQKTL